MNNNYLDKLEYKEILKTLSNYCNTTGGKKIAYNLLPSNNTETVKNNLNETTQAENLITRLGNAPISEIEDITIYLKTLESSASLNIEAILNLTNILKIAQELKQYFYQDNIDISDFSNLENYFSTLYSNQGIIDKVEKCILDKNTIADSASSTLNTIRKKIKNLEHEIKENLNTFIHSANYSKFIQESIVTIRSGRYVIPVKGEYKNNIKGFVHDISSSGSTIFIEPLSIFEMNNQINNMKIEENVEIEKILYDLSKLFVPYINELKSDANTIINLDFVFAKAQYSKSINGITPYINNSKSISLKNARHPLIAPNTVVPISIDLGTDYSTLVITGPNTGGKTVTLKTVGLLTCMACSGLNIPADEGSSIYVFDHIFADIGDNQSITNSLSTFSSHMTNIVDIINNATSDSLILVDELGSGTDPLEGANLAISILQHFKEITALTIATTHYQELKQFALVTDEFENASVEFDTENLQPTYRLLVGVPGKSNAFEISKKLGLSSKIIDRAISMLSSQDLNIEELLKNIYNNKIKIEKDKEELEKNLNQVTLLRKQLEKDISKNKQQEQELINNAKIEARKILLSAKDEASSIISHMNEIATSSASISELNNLRNKLNKDIKSHSVTNKIETTSNSLAPDDISKNLPVYITTLKQNGIIISNISKSNEVQVQIGNIKTNINIKYLKKLNNTPKDIPTYSSYTKISKTQNVKHEINVIGYNVEEATFMVDKFLDDCYLAKLDTVRIVHGKGTGKLKNGIHKFLKTHPYVKSYRMGTFGEGEMGVTVVEMKI